MSGLLISGLLMSGLLTEFIPVSSPLIQNKTVKNASVPDIDSLYLDVTEFARKLCLIFILSKSFAKTDSCLLFYHDVITNPDLR